MRSDKELLELAARAAGLVDTHERAGEFCYTSNHGHGGSVMWDPLTDDGDALRLAVKLGLTVYFPKSPDATCAKAEVNGMDFICEIGVNDLGGFKATRHAIVQAAAAIGAAL